MILDVAKANNDLPVSPHGAQRDRPRRRDRFPVNHMPRRTREPPTHVLFVGRM